MVTLSAPPACFSDSTLKFHTVDYRYALSVHLFGFLSHETLVLYYRFLSDGVYLFFPDYLPEKFEELTGNMDQVNHGSRQVVVSSDSEDEVGILIRSFRRMMDEINRLIDEVYVNKIALKEFELKALQAQINPHFLYNTLSAINWMAIRSNQKEISKVTLASSYVYRTASAAARYGNHGKLYQKHRSVSGNPACNA
mgnify:CR=1 FL=1